MAKRSEKAVLILCTGNYYRSRFAEALFNSVAVRMGLPWRASSRGLALERGVNNVGPMASSAVQALEAMTVKDGRIEIQGDQRERIVAELEKLGYKVKRVES